MTLDDTDRDGIFAGQNPFEIFKDWLNEAQASEPNDPDAIALATCDSAGMPNVRMVLLRQIDTDGFIFFTNYQSRKSKEIKSNSSAAFVVHWKSIRRQIRVRGIVEVASESISDRYFASRSIQSRYAAIASQQSEPIKDRAQLEQEYELVKENLNHPPKRPENWGGWRVRPLEIEFWSDGKHRLHDRFQWKRKSLQDSWLIKRLYP